MKFFIETAELNDIRELSATGLVDGVTTNPSLVAQSGRDFIDVVKEICEIVSGPVSAEVTATDFHSMVRERQKLAKLAPNVTVKVPLTMDGLKACKALTSEGTMVNVTLCFSPGQALLAAKAGATFVSPFVGRVDDVDESQRSLSRDRHRDARRRTHPHHRARRGRVAGRSRSACCERWAACGGNAAGQRPLSPCRRDGHAARRFAPLHESRKRNIPFIPS